MSGLPGQMRLAEVYAAQFGDLSFAVHLPRASRVLRLLGHGQTLVVVALSPDRGGEPVVFRFHGLRFDDVLSSEVAARLIPFGTIGDVHYFMEPPK